MGDSAGVTVSHFGICVSDYERAKRFYIEALGFAVANEVTFAEPFDTLTELENFNGRAAFMHKDGLTVELLHYFCPEAVGPAERRPMNQLGLTHMALVVENIETVADRIEASGGKVHRQTRVSGPLGDMMFCTDPDGVRLELWEKKDAA